MTEAYVAGIGFHPFGRFTDKTLKEIAAEAALAALADAGLDPDGIDAAFCSNAYAGLLNGRESVRGETWLRSAGIGGIPIVNIENACAGGGGAIHMATLAVRSGAYRRVLVVGAEKMYSGDTARAIAAPYAIGQVRTSENLVLFAPLVGETDGLSRGEPLGFTLVRHEDGGLGFGFARCGAQGGV